MPDPQHYDKDGNPVAASYDKDGNVVLAAPTPSGQPKGWFDTAVEALNAIPGMPHPEDLKKLAQWAPSAGGAIGSIVGAPFGASIPAAAIGGMAGQGIKTTMEHATELPGAVADVARNLVSHPVATVMGGLQGMNEGADQALHAGAEQGAMEGVGQVAKAGLKYIAPVVMQSAVKPSIAGTTKALVRGVSAEDLPVIKTMLKEGVNVTPGGIAKLDRIISATNDEIKQAISQVPGTPIDPRRAASLGEQVAAKAGEDIAPDAAVKSSQGVVDQFLNKAANTRAAVQGDQIVRVPTNISAASAQAQKQAGYQRQQTAYGQMGSAEIETRKAILRGLKEDVASEASKLGIDLTEKNAREAGAITAKEAIARRLAVTGNRDVAGLAWLAYHPANSLMFLMDRSPAVKSLIARGAYKAAASAANIPEQTLRLILTKLATSQDTP